MAVQVKVSSSGHTITIQTDNCSPVSASLSPDPGISPTESTSGTQTTITFSGVPTGTYTVTVSCGRNVVSTSIVTIS